MPRMGSRLHELRVRGGHESKAGAARRTGMTRSRSLTPYESAASKAAVPGEYDERVGVSFEAAVRHQGQRRGSEVGLATERRLLHARGDVHRREQARRPRRARRARRHAPVGGRERLVSSA